MNTCKLFTRLENVLTPELEDKLVSYCKDMEINYYRLHATDLKCMAFQLAITNNIEHPFKAEKGLPGKKWQPLFMGRHSKNHNFFPWRDFRDL